MLFALLGACRPADPKDERRVEPAKLAALIKQANKIIVSEDTMQDAKVLFSSTATQDIAEFNDALTVVPPKEYFHCMCIGSPAVRLYRGDTELALITSHHGKSIRCSLWSSDALLKDPEKWLKWFDARKMPEPREEVDEIIARAKQREIAYARWLATMPKSVRALWKQTARDELSPDLKPLRSALAVNFQMPASGHWLYLLGTVQEEVRGLVFLFTSP